MRKFSGDMGYSKRLTELAPFCGRRPRVKYRNQDVDEQHEREKKIFLYKRQPIEENMMHVLFMDPAAIKGRRKWMRKLEEMGHQWDSSMSGRDRPKYPPSSSLDDTPKYLETSSPSQTWRLLAKKKLKARRVMKREMEEKQDIETASRKPTMEKKQDIETASRKPEMEEKQNIETASMAASVRIASKAEIVPSPRKAAEGGLVTGPEGKMTTVESESTQLKAGQKMPTLETEFAGAQALLQPQTTEILPTSPGIVSISAPSQSELMEGNVETVAMLSVETGLSDRDLSPHKSSTFDVTCEITEENEAGDHVRSAPSLMPTLPAIASSSNPIIEIKLVEDNMSKVSPESVEHRAESSLSFEEAWHLFHHQVGEVIDNPDVHPYARGIVEQCSGSKLLIILTGRALAEAKDITVWESTFKYFLSPIKAGNSGADSITPKLKFIYNRLKTHGTKKLGTRMCDLQGCFLYCALFPQDYQFKISTLVEYWIREGLIAGNAEDAREIGDKIVKILVDAALLESVEDGRGIKIHQLIKDFALKLVLQEVEARRLLVTTNFSLMQLPHLGISPSSRQENVLDQNVLKAGAGLMKLPSRENWEQARMIFLMDNELSSLPERPKCRNLLALFLQRNQCLREIPISFFDCMPSLQVLNLSGTGITSLPKSVSKLKSLKELMIRDCKHLVNLPSEVGELQHLELLDLHGTEIDKLPIKTGQLASLKYMKISFYGSVDPMEYSKLPPKLLSKRIISRLLSLKILGIIVTPGDPRWNKIAEGVTRDISKLSNITDLHFYFPQTELLDIFVKTSPSWRGNNLENFNFVVGHDVKRMISRVPHNMKHEYNQHGRCVRFVNGGTTPETVIEVLSRTTSFYLDHHLKIRSLSEFGVRNISGLEICLVRECPEMERIIDGEELTLPFLERLSIHYLEKLKCIWHGNLVVGSFACLKYLHVRTCHQLNFVLTSSMSEHLANLEELVVDDCPAMTAVIQVDQDKIGKPGDALLPRLKSLTLRYLPQLVCAWKGSWPSLERISFYHCPNLKNLDMDYDTKLKSSIKQIEAEKDWWGQLEWKDPSLSQELQAYFKSLDH
uniref:Uncharacterized protein MANES_11G129900 n=2 Tax=Rhizophora mucronata TaxID=61149 RepID=A0A2P2JHR7_RHIMU